jgi:DNA polymerase III subunit delta'
MVSPAFEPLLGQSQAVELLNRAVECDRIATAYLFVGPEGVGRKLAARLFLDVLLRNPSAARHPSTQDNHPDLLWVEPTYTHQGKAMTAKTLLEKGIALPKSRPQVRLEQIREITRFLSQSPIESSRLLVVIDGAQTMGESAANGLLKTLEEPGHGTLILIAQTLDTLLPTIVSRCQRIPFHCLNRTDLHRVLRQLAPEEILDHPQLLGMAQGSPGLAIQHWEKLQTIPAEILHAVQSPPQSCRTCLELAKQIDKALDAESQIWLLDYLQQQYWSTNGQAALLTPLEMAKTYLASYVQPQLVWEMTFLQMMDIQALSHLL